MVNRLVICAILFFIGLQGPMAGALVSADEQIAVEIAIAPVEALQESNRMAATSHLGGHAYLFLFRGVQPRLLAKLVGVADPPVPRSIPPNLLPRLSQQGIKPHV